jgi:hypothetical protein
MGEIEEMRLERERRSQDYQRLLDKEKDGYRVRLAEIETKAKEADKMRSQHMFEYEKERAKWQLEKDQYQCKMQEMEEQVEKLVHQKETLMKENTRIKLESKSTKSSITARGSSINGSQVFTQGSLYSQQ